MFSKIENTFQQLYSPGVKYIRQSNPCSNYSKKWVEQVGKYREFAYTNNYRYAIGKNTKL